MSKGRKFLVGFFLIAGLIIVAVVFYFVGYDRQFTLRDNLLTENSRLKNQLEQKKYEPLLKYEPFFHSVGELDSYYGFSVVLPKGWIMGATAESFPTIESTKKLPSAEWIEELQISYFFEPKLANNTSNFRKVLINISSDKNGSWQLIKNPSTGLPNKKPSFKETTINDLPAIVGISYQEGNTLWHQAAIAINDTVIVHLSFVESSTGNPDDLSAFVQIYKSIKKL